MSNLKAIHEATRLQPINKLMVVGHPLSGYASVEQVLHGCGLQAAAASKTQGLSPTQVSDMLLRAYRVPPIEATQALEALSPINPSPVWQTLALDLLVGNLEQELWGWADPQAIYLLDYWKNLDHQLAFVLVYDSPQASMAGLFDNPEVDCTEDVVQAASANWLAYNEALLNFYLGNTERCLLVHGQQVKAQTADYLRQVKHQMGVELQMPLEGLRGEVRQAGWNALQVELSARVLAANPKVTQMYADLQSVASMPQGHVKNQPSFDTDMAVLSKFVALHRSNLKIQRYVEELKVAKEGQEQAYRQQLEQSISTANHQLRAVQVDLDTLRGEEVNLKQHLTEMMQDYDQVQKHSKNLEKENQQLLTLVEHRQNQIENLTKKEKEHESNINSLNEEIQKINNQKKEETNKIQETNTNKIKILEEENQTLLEDLFKLQEKIESNYFENKKNKQTHIKLTGAANLIKESLQYRLGAELVKSNHTFKDYKRVIELIKKEFANEKNKFQIIDHELLNKYEDKHEAIKLMNHLSYKFGKELVEVKNNKFKIILLPYKLNKIYKDWRQKKSKGNQNGN